MYFMYMCFRYCVTISILGLSEASSHKPANMFQRIVSDYICWRKWLVNTKNIKIKACFVMLGIMLVNNSPCLTQKNGKKISHRIFFSLHLYWKCSKYDYQRGGRCGCRYKKISTEILTLYCWPVWQTTLRIWSQRRSGCLQIYSYWSSKRNLRFKAIYLQSVSF